MRSSAKRCKAFWGDAKFVILVVSKGKRVTGSSVKNIVKFQPQSLSPKNEEQSIDFIRKYLFWNSFKPESMYCNTCYRLLEVWWGAKRRREASQEIVMENKFRHVQTRDNWVYYENGEFKIWNLVMKKQKQEMQK